MLEHAACSGLSMTIPFTLLWSFPSLLWCARSCSGISFADLALCVATLLSSGISITQMMTSLIHVMAWCQMVRNFVCFSGTYFFCHRTASVFFSSEVMLASGIFCIDLHKLILQWNLHWMFAGCGLWHFSVELHQANLYKDVGSACSLVFLQYCIVFSQVDFYLVFDVPLSTGVYHVTLLSI